MSLTKNQLEKLEPLTNHPKYGKLLQVAIGNWEDCDPIKEDYGIWFNEKQNTWTDYTYTTNDMNDCPKCLIGSAIANCKNNFVTEAHYPNGLKMDPQIIKASEEYSLLPEEVCSLVAGFDLGDALFIHKEAYDFGKQVSMILFNDKENEC
jgi:hypothetical protein